MPNVEDTRIALGSGFAETRHRQRKRELQYLHIASWTEREEASTVPHPPPSPSADLDTQPPGQNWDYLDGDGMVLIESDHVFVMSSGLHAKSIERYLLELLRMGSDRGATVPDDFVVTFFLSQTQTPSQEYTMKEGSRALI